MERVLQMAEACAEDVSKNYIFSRDGIATEKVVMEPKNLLENILYFSVSSYTEQIAVINYLDEFIKKHKDVSRQFTSILSLIVVSCLVLE